MIVYMDSSALAKRYVREEGSDRVLELTREATEIVLDVLCVPEVLSGCNRLRRETRISFEQYLMIKAELTEDVREATVIDLGNDVVATAIRCLEESSVRTLDALHVAAAATYACDLFVTGDKRQMEAARLMGLAVEFLGTEHA